MSKTKLLLLSKDKQAVLKCLREHGHLLDPEFIKDFDKSTSQERDDVVKETVRALEEKRLNLYLEFDKSRIPQKILPNIPKNYFIKEVDGTQPPPQPCQYSQCIGVVDKSRRGLKKYCSHRCRLMALYERRKNKEGKEITAPIIYEQCQVCHKPLNKRAGARFCSNACRMKLSRSKQKKDI
ncbi:MAG: hypothetical protein OS112_05140 [Methanoregula sp.]|nr:MAG: hypothetical protein OS112_05140 [Methanoregula sp.]